MKMANKNNIHLWHSLTILGKDLGTLYIDFLGVQHDLLGRLGDIEIDLDNTLVAPRSAEFQVKE